MKNIKALAVATAGLGLVAVGLASPATADTNLGSTTALVGVGSDTSQDVVEGLALGTGGGTTIANYKATGSATITTRTGVAACTNFTRPNGSGNGLNALAAAVGGLPAFGSTNLQGCVDFARSSSGANPSTATGGGTGRLTYVPFAVDSVTFAKLSSSNVPATMDLQLLKDIYSATTATGCIFEPLLPQAGSGTRNFFLDTLGFTSRTIGATGGPGNCVKDTVNGVAVQEHDGRFLTNANQLVPFSTGQYIAQTAGVISDIRGRASLGSIDFTSTGAFGPSPLNLSATFPQFNRPLYNVIPTDALTLNATTPFNYPLIRSTFVGSTSTICSATAQAIVNQYGFASIPTGYAGSGVCGDTSKKNTN